MIRFGTLACIFHAVAPYSGSKKYFHYKNTHKQAVVGAKVETKPTGNKNAKLFWVFFYMLSEAICYSHRQVLTIIFMCTEAVS